MPTIVGVKNQYVNIIMPDTFNAFIENLIIGDFAYEGIFVRKIYFVARNCFGNISNVCVSIDGKQYRLDQWLFGECYVFSDAPLQRGSTIELNIDNSIVKQWECNPTNAISIEELLRCFQSVNRIYKISKLIGKVIKKQIKR